MAKLQNVFCLVTDCHVTTGYYRELWGTHFEAGLQGATRKCFFPKNVNFDWAREPQGDPKETDLRASSSQRILEQIKLAHASEGLDAVISYAYTRDLDLGLVDETIRLGIPWINFYCDSTHRFSLVKDLAARASLNWFPESAARHSYQALGRPSVCLPYALNVEGLPDLSAHAPVRTAAFIGLPTTNRIRQLGAILLLGGDVEIRGKGWTGGVTPFHNPVPLKARLRHIVSSGGTLEKIGKRIFWPIVKKRAGGELSNIDFQTFVRTTSVILGLNQGCDEQGRYQSYLKFRDIEFPGYGSCYLTERNADIENAFEAGKEILTYSGVAEASSHLRRAAKDKVNCREIGLRARKRVLAEHTWAKRVEQLAKAL